VAQRLAALRRLIRDERPDIVHTALFESNVLGRLASIGQRSLVVSSLVNTSYDPIRLQNPDINPLKLAAVRAIDTLTARYLTTHFHAITEAVKTSASATLGVPADRITTIERGRDGGSGPASAEARRQARLTFGVSETDEVIVSVGRQEYQKGQRFLVEAMAEVVARRPKAILLIAGRPGRQSDLLEETCRAAGFGERVRMLGHRNDVPALLASADLFVFPSLYEGLGGALIEAMAAGLPIVASKIPAIECVVEDGRNARLVERGNSRALAAAIIDLLENDTQARAFARRSRGIFDERFTLDRCTARMIDFYRRLAACRDHTRVDVLQEAAP
jgi:glycosyltransferase involved in cell wall biosynthesis